MTRELPAAARILADAVTDAVTAAGAGDAAAFAEATARLAASDSERVRLVLGGAVGAVLEDVYPDGPDPRDALGQCVRWAAPWYPELDPGALVVVLTGALGAQPGDTPAVTPSAVHAHGVLLLAHLLAGPPRPLAPYLGAALAELARAETVEMP
ncbi:MAG TPA: hypothetical protein VGD72_07355 [Mycobacteriales bacterium]